MALQDSMTLTSVLPYRTDALALSEWLEARARGRSAEQLRDAVHSPKGVEGTAAAAAALGFVDTDAGRLTDLGERFALGDEAERRTLLAGALRAYAPFSSVFAAVEARGGGTETEVRWIEALWATRGFGSSESNRREGAAAFGRLVDFAGLGEYVPGRRGRPTRIRWSVAGNGRTPPTAPNGGATRTLTAAAPDLFTTPAEPPSAPVERPSASSPQPRRPSSSPQTAEAAASERENSPLRRHDGARAGVRPRADLAVNSITVPLAGDAVARVEVPLRLPPAEKRRLLDLLELLITEE